MPQDTPRAMPAEPTQELLVAIEGTGSERGVLSIAELLSRRERVNAHLVGVDNPSSGTSALTPQERSDILAAQHSRLLARIRRVLHHVVGRGAYWSVDAALGTPLEVLADETRKGHTRLILLELPELGRNRPGAAATLMKIVAAVDIPVLAVPSNQERLPTRLLVATDFSSACTRAARAALSVLGPRGHATLVHVQPETDGDALGQRGLRRASGDGLARRFEELRQELDDAARHSIVPRHEPTSIVNDTVLLRGEPAPAILEYAATHRTDLIALGTRRLRVHDMVPLGSVSMAVLRGSRCAVLLARPSARRRVRGPTDPFFKAHHTAT